ncbi:XRE family transcriptional regulator [Apilactobacillus timberlakei]|uniref:XRE family transcriptional regulator n=1 Tax=Apilactobacillus timberlakei TaxID=2008380 RepID=A0ABY2YSE3_9LACO|nr:XRE family transcriptional regulator [Apilactobacillus timberlakei]TPR14152.1 XRE family transcriptional regulator [Apilactobacillus timberlakei]TPR16406.1 XRE family transcriptional regulator [Apilactobacillus timberlakei]
MKNVFSSQLIKLRRQRNFSQGALANKMFVSRQSISKWENGESEPSIDKLIDLSDVFNVDLNYLLIGKNKISKEIILKIRSLYKAFNKPVLKDINLEIHGNERVALLGNNGTGKSTLFKTLIGIEKPDKGKITYSFNKKKDLNVMPQKDNLISGLKVNEHINLSAAINKNYSKELTNNLINKFNLADNKNDYVSSLSGGQKRKLSLLISVIRPSKLLLLDEPTVGMDLDTIDFFWRYIDHIGGSVITITHDFNQIDKFFSRVILMKNGKIAQDASVDTIHSHNQTIEQWYRIMNKE